MTILALKLNILSFALLGLAAVSYARRQFHVFWPTVVLFFPVLAWTTFATWWAVSPLFTVFLLTFTLGISLLALLLFAVDVIWAPFCLEMTYLTPLCWILCPLLVFANYSVLCVVRSVWVVY